MSVRSELRKAELQMRETLIQEPASALEEIVEAYNVGSKSEREALISVLASRVVISEVLNNRCKKCHLFV